MGPSSFQDIDVPAIEDAVPVDITDSDNVAPPKESASAPENLNQAEKPAQGKYKHCPHYYFQRGKQ